MDICELRALPCRGNHVIDRPTHSRDRIPEALLRPFDDGRWKTLHTVDHDRKRDEGDARFKREWALMDQDRRADREGLKECESSQPAAR
jgi:hypothetical protein